ncbi:MAG: alanine racemase, partial [Sphingobacterium sp.]
MYTVAKIISFLIYRDALIADPDQLIVDLCYDTRKILVGSRSLFFALKNVRDGHNYIQEAYQKGIRAFVISDDSVDRSLYSEATFILVDDTLGAMQQLALQRRSDCKKVRVVAITGSNGKTVVKEWLTQLLGNDYKVYQSPKSYNSQIGVALSLWNLSDEYDFAFIEAGISEPGEMAILARMIQPQVGIFTNIGNAHASGFASQQEKLLEKLLLFSRMGIDIIYPSAYRLDKYLGVAQNNLYAFGSQPSDWITVDGIQNSGPFSTKIKVIKAGQRHEFIVPFTDKGSIENILICITFLSYSGYPLADIAQRIAVLRSLEMRLQLKKGKKGCSIIDDSYSNDLASLQIALDFLMQQKQHESKTLVLSGMEGLDDKVATKLFDLLARHPLARIILVGAELAFLKALAVPTMLFNTTGELLAGAAELDFSNQTVLIKGSRFYHLEDLSRMLSEKTHETVLEINLKAIEYNLQRYRALVPQGVKIMAMVKAFSYGSGSYEVANLLQYNKVDYLTVAFADEGVELRQNGITLPIMVLSPDEQVFDALVTSQLEPEIYSFRILSAFIAFLARKGKVGFPIHIKVDTGMHRLGFMSGEIT